jgi:hypothetical protein
MTIKIKTTKQTCKICRGKKYIVDTRNGRKIKCFGCAGMGWVSKVE